MKECKETRGGGMTERQNERKKESKTCDEEMKGDEVEGCQEDRKARKKEDRKQGGRNERRQARRKNDRKTEGKEERGQEVRRKK